MSIAALLNLKETITLSLCDHTDEDRNVKAFAEIFAQLFRQFVGARRHQINVLSHTRLSHVRIDSGGAEHNYVVTSAQEIEHSFMNRRQRQRFAHGKLLECEYSSV